MTPLDKYERELLKRFSKAKKLPCPVRVVGGIRRVYLRPDRVRVVNGRNR
jgi:hypothetical protein